jgi:hypothetical protein
MFIVHGERLVGFELHSRICLKAERDGIVSGPRSGIWH